MSTPTHTNNDVYAENRKLLVIGGAVLSAIVLVGFILVWYILSCFRWRRTRDSFSLGTTGLKRFEYRELCDATSGFSKESELGEGAFGTVYKGSYTDKNGSQDVAVKKKKQTTGEVGDFMAELRTISETRHINLVELKGWCCSRNKWDLIDFMCWCRKQRVNLFLVYELVPNGTLKDHLHHKEEILPWEKRYCMACTTCTLYVVTLTFGKVKMNFHHDGMLCMCLDISFYSLIYFSGIKYLRT
jgi:hypothetical protein